MVVSKYVKIGFAIKYKILEKCRKLEAGPCDLSSLLSLVFQEIETSTMYGNRTETRRGHSTSPECCKDACISPNNVSPLEASK